MICQRNAAIRTLVDKATIGTAYELVCAPAVNEQYALLLAAEVCGQLILQLKTEVSASSTPKLPAHIDYAHVRKLHFVIALVKLKKTVAPLSGGVHTLDVRRCGAENEQSVTSCAAVLCDLPCVVSRRIFRLIAVDLLLVDYHKTEIFAWSKYGAPCSDDELCRSVFDPLPFVVSLTDGQAAVQHGDLVAEVR